MSDTIKEVQAIDTGGAGKTIPPKIRPKHLLFIQHYMDKKNVADAVRAVYKCKDPSKTGNLIMKRPEVIQEITRREEEFQRSLTRDKPTFLRELVELRQRAREKGRIDSEIKLMSLEASILGLTQPEQQQQINVFSSLDRAERFLNGFKDTNSDKTGQDIAKAEIVEGTGQGAQVKDIDTAPTQTSALPVDDVYTSDSAQTISLDIPN